MPNNPRFLITTSDERTWKFDRPVIFLGEWCKRYDRKEIWSAMDAIVAKPYGIEADQKETDHKIVLALEEHFFPILCNILNEFHNTTHKNRFWRIILGHWFRRYIGVIVNRTNTLLQCIREYEINGISILSDENYILGTLDSNSANWAHNDEQWNSIFFSRILALTGKHDFSVEIVPGDENTGYIWPHPPATDMSLKRRILRWGFQVVRKIAGVFSRQNDAFIINSYLPLKEDIQLQLALRQMPQLWVTPTLNATAKYDNELRKRLSDIFSEKTMDDGILHITISSLLFQLMPYCYLEGFKELEKQALSLPWPAKPKFIFTSNNFDTDEVFKCWAGLQTEKGVKYIIGQHGNSYGTSRSAENSVEEIIADKFITWGWKDKLQQHKPAFIFKTTPLEPRSGSKLYNLQSCYYQPQDTWDNTAEWKDYFVEQQVFLSLLDPAIKKHTVIRLHYSHIFTKSGEAQRFEDWDNSFDIDLGFSPMTEVVAQSHLIVFSSDSTGILETLSQNIPIIAFWQNGLDHVRDSALPYYQLLIDAGILHLTPEAAANKVNQIWNDINGWWMSALIQETRVKFCNQFARVSKNRIDDILTILNSQ